MRAVALVVLWWSALSFVFAMAIGAVVRWSAR